MDRTSDFPWHASKNPISASQVCAKRQERPRKGCDPTNTSRATRLERGDVTTIAGLAREEGMSDRYVSCVIWLAWLSPSVLERLVLRRKPTVLSIFDLCGVADLPWVEQPERVFD